MIRIKVIQRPSVVSIDGLQFDHFQPGHEYEVGNSLGAVMLAEGWAEPAPLDSTEPVVPFSESDPFAPTPYRDQDAPANLVREHYPPYLHERADVAANLERRKRRRPR